MAAPVAAKQSHIAVTAPSISIIQNLPTTSSLASAPNHQQNIQIAPNSVPAAPPITASVSNTQQNVASGAHHIPSAGLPPSTGTTLPIPPATNVNAPHQGTRFTLGGVVAGVSLNNILCFIGLLVAVVYGGIQTSYVVWTGRNDARQSCRDDQAIWITSAYCTKVLAGGVQAPPLGRRSMINAIPFMSASKYVFNESNSFSAATAIVLTVVLGILTFVWSHRWPYGYLDYTRWWPANYLDLYSWAAKTPLLSVPRQTHSQEEFHVEPDTRHLKVKSRWRKMLGTVWPRYRYMDMIRYPELSGNFPPRAEADPREVFEFPKRAMVWVPRYGAWGLERQLGRNPGRFPRMFSELEGKEVEDRNAGANEKSIWAAAEEELAMLRLNSEIEERALES